MGKHFLVFLITYSFCLKLLLPRGISSKFNIHGLSYVSHALDVDTEKFFEMGFKKIIKLFFNSCVRNIFGGNKRTLKDQIFNLIHLRHDLFKFFKNFPL